MSDLIFGTLGEQLLEITQSFSNPILDLFFGVVTTLGSTLPIIIIIVFFYYSVNKDFMKKLIYLLVLSSHMNAVLKIFFHTPRPYQFDTKYQVTTNVLNRKTIWSESSYSFPSAHSQSQGTIWSFIFSKYRSAEILIIGIFFLVSIPLSRSYLGVHWIGDIVVGLLLGFFLTFLFIYFDKHYKIKINHITETKKILLGLFVSLGLLILGVFSIFLGTLFPFNQSILFTDPSVWERADLGIYPGIFGGFVIGQILENKLLNFEVKGLKSKNTLIRSIIGLISIILLYIGTQTIGGLMENLQTSFIWITTITNYLSYFLIAFCLAYPIPWLFTKIEAKLLS